MLLLLGENAQRISAMAPLESTRKHIYVKVHEVPDSKGSDGRSRLAKLANPLQAPEKFG
jgi:hypothetical protein